jgi:hypothetical protein
MSWQAILGDALLITAAVVLVVFVRGERRRSERAVERRRALEGSIRKWERIVAGTGSDLGSDNCPLCQLYLRRKQSAPCDGCPVMERTGKPFCAGSPYETWSSAEEELVSRLTVQSEEDRRLAQAELDFLKSLL